jgi:glucose-6-phosphate 1-dehydrogenase
MKTKLVIFGITGDLGRRKLLPALQSIVQSGECPELSIIGVSRREVDVPALLQESTGKSDLSNITRVFTMDLTVAEDYVSLKQDLNIQSDEQVLIYLSVPPSATADIVDFLGRAELNTPHIKLLFEKPFGFDLDSAKDFLERIGHHFGEEQVYRIDHYMAKQVAAEVIRLRSSAEGRSFHWGKEYVAGIDITATESIGIEDRVSFYEETGALRDFIQGHLMQLLSLVLMDLSAPCTIDDLADRRFKALAHLQPADPAKSIRAQYDGYKAEVSNPASLTETFASIQLESSNERWRGVPLRLTTGKKMNEKKSAIVIRYKDGSKDIFEEGAIAGTGTKVPDAYECVLVEAIRGRKYIFTSGPEVLRSWELLTPILDAWATDNTPLPLYKPGTSASELI